MRIISLLLLLSLVSFSMACSPINTLTREGFIGGLTGTAIGGGVGAALADEYGHRTENILINAAIGAGAGLLAGGVVHEVRAKHEHKKARVVRQAAMIGESQREIDLLRREMQDASTWGRGEVKPWSERYMGHSPNRPFQGVAP